MLNNIDRFLDQNTFTEATRVTYKNSLNTLNAYLDRCGIALDDLDEDTFRSFLKSRHWSNNTVRMLGNSVKSYIRWRYGNDHPVLKVQLPRDNAKPGRALSFEQLSNLLYLFDTTTPLGWRDLSIICLMVETGLRASEVCRLKVSDLNLQKCEFTVLTKGQNWHIGGFNDIVARQLDVWLEIRKTIARPGVPYVFVGIKGSKPGTGMTPAGLRANFRKYGKRAKIGQFSPHDMRRSMAVLATLKGAPAPVVKDIGGWNDLNTFYRYLRTMSPKSLGEYSPLSDLIINLEEVFIDK
jgi:integrase